MAVRALERTYRPERGLFAFRLRRSAARGNDGTHASEPPDFMLEGISRRYTAIALIGLADHPSEAAERVFRGRPAADVCRSLVEEVCRHDQLGDIAVALWAAARTAPDMADTAYRRLLELDPLGGRHPIVELSWALSAFCMKPTDLPDEPEWIDGLAKRLMAQYRPSSRMFPHWPDDSPCSWPRSHVCCFADFVYPIQALSLYALRRNDARASAMARSCAARMCELQGRDGQWWWHFDVRTSDVLERYPVYAVHQNSMAPMALFAVRDAGGADHGRAIANGLRWLSHAPELNGSLIDRTADVVWRKVARYEPGKLVRGLQAVLSRVHPHWRVPFIDTLFSPGRVDFESRPYHMGWILHAWPPDRVVPDA
jgi:hypothetical protein